MQYKMNEIEVLLRYAKLNDFPKEYHNDVLSAFNEIQPVLTRIRRERDRADQAAHVFDPRRFFEPVSK